MESIASINELNELRTTMFHNSYRKPVFICNRRKSTQLESEPFTAALLGKRKKNLSTKQFCQNV